MICVLLDSASHVCAGSVTDCSVCVAYLAAARLELPFEPLPHIRGMVEHAIEALGLQRASHKATGPRPFWPPSFSGLQSMLVPSPTDAAGRRQTMPVSASSLAATGVSRTCISTAVPSAAGEAWTLQPRLATCLHGVRV